MIANIEDIFGPVIRDVYHDWLGVEDRLLIWDVSTTPQVTICENEDCQTAIVDEDGDRVHETFVAFLRMVFAKEDTQDVSCFAIPGEIILSGRISEAMREVRVRQDFKAQAEDMADLREVGESIIKEYRP